MCFKEVRAVLNLYFPYIIVFIHIHIYICIFVISLFCMKKWVISLISLIFLGAIFLSLIIWYNSQKIVPTEHEIELITNSLGDISIRNENDLLRVQNKVIDVIKHSPATENPYQETNLDTILTKKRGLCYDRSMILQKIMIYNNLEIVPVFLYYNGNNPKSTSVYNFFDKGLPSHNVFEVYLSGRRILVRTNSKMQETQNLQQYLDNGPMPDGTKYLRHLNNRNGYFISPYWVPDIY
jgi:hypothetical protein